MVVECSFSSDNHSSNPSEAYKFFLQLLLSKRTGLAHFKTVGRLFEENVLFEFAAQIDHYSGHQFTSSS